VEEAVGRGEKGRGGARGRGWSAAARGKKGRAPGWRLKENPTGGPHLSARGREEREGGGGAGRFGLKQEWAAGLGWAVRLDLFFFLFLFFSFQILFKPNSNLLNSNLFPHFKHKFIQIF
jgi:hypothetical protein